jgi:N-acetylmuramoyl-L-alanine amidase
MLIPAICLLLFSFSKKPVSGSQHLTDEIVLIIDPGHGGSDVGGQSAKGLNEKNLTLSIAKLIQKESEGKGIRVVLTRTQDEAVELSKRISFSHSHAGSVFISLHFNVDQTDQAKSGIECVISESNAHVEKSKLLAGQLLHEFKSLGGIEVNEVKKAGAYVLKNNTIPAVALELGYLSNESDCAFISNEVNQKSISQTIVTSVLKFNR